MIPTCYFNPNITNIIDFFVEDGFKSYTELPSTSKDTIISACIKELGEDAYNCLIDSENITKVMCHFRKFLLTYEYDEIDDMVEAMRTIATDYFEDDMNWLFSDRIAINQSIQMAESGFIQRQDQITGEIEWRKSA
jgi:hypothetical protein